MREILVAVAIATLRSVGGFIFGWYQGRKQKLKEVEHEINLQ